MSLLNQIAQKLHACTEPIADGRPNLRAHDIADLLIIDDLAGAKLNLAEVRAACVGVFSLRGTHAWPPAVVAPELWTGLWRRIVEEDGFPITNLGEAMDGVRTFIGRIDAAATQSQQRT